MKQTFSLALFITALSLSFNAYSQKLKSFALTMKTEYTGTFTGGSSYTYLFSPQKKNSDGSTTYKCQMTAVEVRDMDYSSKKVVPLINTARLGETNFSHSDMVNKLAMLNKPFSVRVSSRGEVLSVDGVEAIVEAAGTKWQLQPDIVQQFKGNIPAFKSELQRCFLRLPAKGKIGFGSTWVASGAKYDVKAIKGSLLEIDMALDSSNNSISGRYTYNDVVDLVERANINLKINNAKAQPAFTRNETSTIQIAYNAKPSVIDTAWINMAVKASYWSNALKKGPNTDSAKVFKFFAENDKRFGKDNYYLVAKLGLMQGLNYKNSHLAYDSVLVLTPNKALKGHSSHMFNKMRGALAMSVDTTLDLINYFYETDSFGGWLHDTYAQQFLNTGWDLKNDEGWKNNLRKERFTEKQINKIIDDHEKSKVNGEVVLNRLSNSKVAKLKQSAKALALWVKAKNDAGNTAYLVKAADTLRQMNDDYMKRGDGGRYAMLIYKLLLKAGKAKEANNLLDHTLSKLEKYTNDTLNNDRYADQNLLAYAYYLKYEAAKPADSVKALAYLAKAAQYSPLNNRQKAYSSFYDRVFLESKESYREEFIDRLFNSGNQEQALVLFAEHINAQPERMDEMQKIFEEKVKGKTFKDFVSASVMTSWLPAPDFKLTGVDGKERSLADYKNKWLVLDFWGTWCGPCREELPHVNQFNEDVLKGQYAGVNFMSVSCYDTPEKVKEFLADNKYGIPVLMSDNQVQKNYKISGYPSKILISPDGKMLSINFGSDWVSIVKKFSELYAAN